MSDPIEWTAERTDVVLKGFKKHMSPKAIARQLDTTEGEIRQRLLALGIKPRHQCNWWTPEEDEILVDLLMVQRLQLGEAAKRLGRQRITVSRRAKRFGYKPYQNAPRHPKELVEQIIQLRLGGKTVLEVSKEVERDVNTVNHILQKADVRRHTDRNWSDEEGKKLVAMVEAGESPHKACKLLSRSGRQMIARLKKLYPKEQRPESVKTFIYRFNFSLHRLIAGKIASSQRRCAEHGWAFDLDEEWIEKRLKEQGFKCQYSGTSFDLTKPNGDTFSLERVDSSRGYTRDNVVITTWDINSMKGDLSLDRFIELCRRITILMSKAPLLSLSPGPSLLLPSQG